MANNRFAEGCGITCALTITFIACRHACNRQCEKKLYSYNKEMPFNLVVTKYIH